MACVEDYKKCTIGDSCCEDTLSSCMNTNPVPTPCASDDPYCQCAPDPNKKPGAGQACTFTSGCVTGLHCDNDAHSCKTIAENCTCVAAPTPPKPFQCGSSEITHDECGSKVCCGDQIRNQSDGLCCMLPSANEGMLNTRLPSMEIDGQRLIGPAGTFPYSDSTHSPGCPKEKPFCDGNTGNCNDYHFDVSACRAPLGTACREKSC